MEFPATTAFGEPAELIALSTIAKQHNMSNDTVYAMLSAKGIEPALVVPFSSGFMRQYRADDVAGIAGAIAAWPEQRKAARKVRLAAIAQRGAAHTPEVRAKAVATFKATKAAKNAAELKKLRKLAKLVKELGVG